MSRAIIISAGLAAGLAACSAPDQSDQPAPGSDQPGEAESAIAAGLEGQTYSAQTEVAGYYLPQDPVAIGDIVLDHISVALDWEAEPYINGEPDSFPPVMLHFDDTSSPTGTGELGNTYYEITHRVVPHAFSVTDEGLSLTGQHELFGEVRFEGTWNADHIAAMQASNPQGAQAALTGDLSIGDVVFQGVTFQGWLGD
ncbi:hypothetical protein [Hyphobacterium sp.]|uniref:hypothetical protein n=1 Tax=Hyphobacterium sp. TaxID=2004662 RepID=UPI003BA9C6EA